VPDEYFPAQKTALRTFFSEFQTHSKRVDGQTVDTPQTGPKWLMDFASLVRSSILEQSGLSENDKGQGEWQPT